ncbi:uncharacterized protein [Dermacentor andersoni]|uniref:uncharacterized protein isoform X2 n=1 Tax=Dermacentor andersoni TaxID=34620 RepID=UPI003B3B48D7
MNSSRQNIMEQFLETVRLFPFLYDKTHPEYKDKDVKMNRWAIIGRTFDLTGPQAAAKFKNVKDRWLKIVSASEGARKSGAGGEAGKVHTKWTLFDIVDGMLRHTPNYAERSSSNVPPEEDVSILPSPLSSNSPSSRRLVASCISSPAATLFQEMYSDSPNDFTDEDDLRLPSTSESAASAAGSSGLSTSQAGVAAPDPGSAKRRASNGPSSRTKRRQSDSFEEAVKDVLGSCSATLLELKKKEMPAPTDDSQEAANWIAAKLRMLPHKKRREFFKPNERIWTLYSNTTKNITCVNDRTTRNTEREVTINRTFVMDGNKTSVTFQGQFLFSYPSIIFNTMQVHLPGWQYFFNEKIVYQDPEDKCAVFVIFFYRNNAIPGPSSLPVFPFFPISGRSLVSPRLYLPAPGTLLNTTFELRAKDSFIDLLVDGNKTDCIAEFEQYKIEPNKTIYEKECRSYIK